MSFFSKENEIIKESGETTSTKWYIELSEDFGECGSPLRKAWILEDHDIFLHAEEHIFKLFKDKPNVLNTYLKSQASDHI
jgi:hypothetical protein